VPQRPLWGNDVRQAVGSHAPPDLWQRLFHPTASAVLLQVLQEHQPAVVLTTSWLRFMEKQGFEEVFKRTELESVSTGFHEAWEAPQQYGQTRWLSKNHAGERW
jgi:hypothetical protein